VKVKAAKAPAVAQKPRPAYQPKPTYPENALAGGREQAGSVRVRYRITPTGAVEGCEVLSADPPGLFEQAVKDAVSQWKYVPAKDDSGRFTEFWEECEFTFKLVGKS
jgi:protein TonB